MFRQLWTAFLDLVYPPKCPVCRTPVDDHGQWCGKCLSAVLSIRWVNIYSHHLRYLESCRTVCQYAAGVKRLIHDMKFRHSEKYAVYLTWLLERDTVFASVDFDVVIPVPLHPDRLAERGYNQTERIFKPWAVRRRLCWVDDCLYRTRSTLPQWELALAERRKNIKGAFAVTRPEWVKGKRILLVDDIFTSGLTLDECARVLKQQGAASVHGLVVASGAV